MKEKSVRIVRKIAKTALLLCVVSLLGLLGYYTYKSIMFKPYKVRVSNVTDSAFTVSWVTDSPMVGVVYYGEKDNFLPGPLAWIGKKKAVDDRDYSNAQTECVSKFNKKASKSRDENFTIDARGYDCNEVKVLKKDEYYTHHVTVQNLDAEKEYFFRVGNGYVSYKNGKTKDVGYIEREMPAISEFKQKTQPKITDVSSPNPAYGTSYNVFSGRDGQVGIKKNFDSVIFLKTFKDGVEYPLMSAVCNSDGGWSIDLTNVRKNDGTSLEMEDTYLEFIPQVDNARPGASGTTKFEELEFPLDLMGNNVDDLEKVDANTKQLETNLRNLIQGVIAYDDYENAVSCWSISGCQYRTFSDRCPSGYTSVKSQCNPTGQPAPVPTKLCCYKGSSGCHCTNVVQCASGYTEYSSKAECENSIVQGSETVSCCAQSGADNCICITGRQPGSCGGEYPKEYKADNRNTAVNWCKKDIPQVAMNCCLYSASTNSCACGKACQGVNITKDACDKKVEEAKKEKKSNCFCTSNSCTSKLKKDGTTCKASDGCYADKSTCQSKLEKTCYKCDGNKVISRATTGSCESGEFTSRPICKVVQGECSGGVQSTIHLNISQPVGPQPQASLLEQLFVRDAYAGVAGATVTRQQTSIDGECNQTSMTPPASQGVKSTCSGSNCKNCWSRQDCFLIKVEKSARCPSGYQENKNDNNVCPSVTSLQEKFNITEGKNQAVVDRCTDEGQTNLQPKPGITWRIVSGGCKDGCYVQYLHSDGSVCGAIKLNGVYCENQYCPEQQKKDLSNETGGCHTIQCDHNGGCICPDNCDSGKSIRKGGLCGIKPPVACYCLNSCEKIETSAKECEKKDACYRSSEECTRNEPRNDAGLKPSSPCFYITGGECKPSSESEICFSVGASKTEKECLSKFHCFYREGRKCKGIVQAQECNNSKSDKVVYESLESCEDRGGSGVGDKCYRKIVVQIGHLSISNCHEVEDSSCSNDNYYKNDSSCGNEKRDASLYGFSISNPYKMCAQGSGVFTSFEECESWRKAFVAYRETVVHFVPLDIPLNNLVLFYSTMNYKCCEYTNSKNETVKGFVSEEEDCSSEYSGKIIANTIECVPSFSSDNSNNSIHDAPSEVAEELVDNKLVFKASAEEEKTNEILYLPEAGVHMVNFSKSNTALPLLGGENKRYLFFENRDGIDGYQPPEDPGHPKENEDMIVPQSAVVVSVSQETTAKEMTFKKGINIVSFNFLPFGLNQDKKMDSKEFLQIANSNNYNISRISYFSAGKWDGGTVYDSKTKETKGMSFDLTLGKGYLIVAEQNCTVSIPAYNIESSIPIAFSSGWNLVGVHGYDTQYTAKSLINSINSIEGLKANNVTYWPTSKSMYQGFQLSGGREYGQDFSISPDLGYFVRINEYTVKDETCKSINWQPGGDANGKCN